MASDVLVMARMRRTDDQTAEQLLSGRLAPEDAPPGLSGVASLFASAAVPAHPADPDEALLTAMSVAAVSAEPHNRRKQMLSKSRSAKIGAVAFGGLVLLGGTAAAGELPDQAQAVAHDVAAAVGVELPDSASNVAKAVHEARLQADEDELTGRERGKAISEAARTANGSKDKANGGAADVDDEGSPTRGKSADAHEDHKPADAGDVSDTKSDDVSAESEGADNADLGADNADENAEAPALPDEAQPADEADAGLERRP